MRIYRRDDQTIALEGATPIERALLQVGSERSAIRRARKMYDLDQPTARLLVRIIRGGECAGCGQQGCLTCQPKEADQ